MYAFTSFHRHLDGWGQGPGGTGIPEHAKVPLPMVRSRAWGRFRAKYGWDPPPHGPVDERYLNELVREEASRGGWKIDSWQELDSAAEQSEAAEAAKPPSRTLQYVAIGIGLLGVGIAAGLVKLR